MLISSEACERNKAPILEVLQKSFRGCRRVLEVGSGTGQHAVHFSAALADILWQPTELPGNLDILRQRLLVEGCGNLLELKSLDVFDWPGELAGFDAGFSANTLHIMSWQGVEAFFRGMGAALDAEAALCIYGPFRYCGKFTTESNRRFDQSLQQRDSQSGIRDFEAVNELAGAQGFVLSEDHALPANNQLLVWHRNA